MTVFNMDLAACCDGVVVYRQSRGRDERGSVAAFADLLRVAHSYPGRVAFSVGGVVDGVVDDNVDCGDKYLPTVTTLCGSTRFSEAHALANMHLSLAGRIVIPLGMLGHTDVPEGAKFLTSDGDESTPEKRGLDRLHFRKIDVSDGVYVINVGGYVGSSTRREIEYARNRGKTVEWMFPEFAA